MNVQRQKWRKSLLINWKGREFHVNASNNSYTQSDYGIINMHGAFCFHNVSISIFLLFFCVSRFYFRNTAFMGTV